MLWEHLISVIATALNPWLAEVCIPALSLVAPLSAPVKEAGDGRRLCICSKNFLPMKYPGILAILVFMCYMVLREGCNVVRKLPWNSRSIWKIWINSGAKRGWNLFCSSLQYEEIFHWESQGRWAWALNPQVKANIITYNSAISACEKRGRWQNAQLLMVQLKVCGLFADVITFNSTISCLLTA